MQAAKPSDQRGTRLHRYRRVVTGAYKLGFQRITFKRLELSIGRGEVDRAKPEYLPRLEGNLKSLANGVGLDARKRK
jgi:hypothetical protein